MRTVFSIVWMFLVAWLAVAVVASTDSDINGLQGLASFSSVMSVTILALGVTVPLLGCLFIWWRYGFRILFRWVAGYSILTSLVITIAGSTSTSFTGLALSFGALVVISLAVNAIAVLPAILSRPSRDLHQA